MLRLAASLEARSEHPLAEAIVRDAAARGLMLEKVEGFQAVAGYGIEGVVDGRKVAAGAARAIWSGLRSIWRRHAFARPPKGWRKTARRRCISPSMAGWRGAGDLRSDQADQRGGGVCPAKDGA